MRFRFPRSPFSTLAATEAVLADKNILILSDRAQGPGRIPIPALLATAAVHHHLIRKGLRTAVGLVLETGEPRSGLATPSARALAAARRGAGDFYRARRRHGRYSPAGSWPQSIQARRYCRHLRDGRALSAAGAGGADHPAG